MSLHSPEVECLLGLVWSSCSVMSARIDFISIFNSAFHGTSFIQRLPASMDERCLPTVTGSTYFFHVREQKTSSTKYQRKCWPLLD